MKNNDRNTWYAPLSAQFQLIEEAMPLSRFAAIEAVLYLLSLTAPDADPTKAYLLFTQYQLIGTTQCSDIEHTLQQARSKLCLLYTSIYRVLQSCIDFSISAKARNVKGENYATIKQRREVCI